MLNGKMTVGQLVQFITYCGYLFGPLSWMTHLPRAMMQMITSLNRIYDVLDEEPLIADHDNSKEFPIEERLLLKIFPLVIIRMSQFLENISFQVKPGEMIGHSRCFWNRKIYFN